MILSKTYDDDDDDDGDDDGNDDGDDDGNDDGDDDDNDAGQKKVICFYTDKILVQNLNGCLVSTVPNLFMVSQV